VGELACGPGPILVGAPVPDLVHGGPDRRLVDLLLVEAHVEPAVPQADRGALDAGERGDALLEILRAARTGEIGDGDRGRHDARRSRQPIVARRPRKRRRRNELETTKTLENAIAAPAMIGLR
jgi:hypothetical protein